MPFLAENNFKSLLVKDGPLSVTNIKGIPWFEFHFVFICFYFVSNDFILMSYASVQLE